MGGTVTMTPSGTVTPSNGWRDETGATIGAGGAAKLADSLDTTYITDTVLSNTGTTIATIPFTNPVLPAGAAVASIVPKIRASQAAGTRGLNVRGYRNAGADGSPPYTTPNGKVVPTSTIKDFSSVAGGFIPPQVGTDGAPMAVSTYLNDFKVDLMIYGIGTVVEDHRVYKASVDVNYVDPPTVSNVALEDVNDLATTLRPRFVWEYGSTDGFPQYEYRAVVWALADVTGYPGGRAAFEASPDIIFGDTTGNGGALGPGYVSAGNKFAKAWTLQDGTAVAGRTVSSEARWANMNNDLAATGQYVVYVQASALYNGFRLEGPSWDSLDFTMAVTPPAAPTSLTSAWQYPKAALVANQTDQYRTKVDVTVPAATIPAGFTGRRVMVEHSADGGTNWYPIPVGTKEAGTAAATITFWDTAARPNTSMRYRARTVLWNTSVTLPSAYTTLGTAVTATFDQFVLRDPLDEGTSAIVLHLESDEGFRATRRESFGEYRSLGSDLPVFASDVVEAFRFPGISHVAANSFETFRFNVLRDKRTTLMIQGDMEGWYYWVRFGEDVESTLLRQTNRVDFWRRTERHVFDLIQTWPPHGQPRYF